MGPKDINDVKMVWLFLQVNPNIEGLVLFTGGKLEDEGEVGTSEQRYRCQDSSRCGRGYAEESGGSELVRADQSYLISREGT